MTMRIVEDISSPPSRVYAMLVIASLLSIARIVKVPDSWKILDI
jgi:hypothetical protein